MRFKEELAVVGPKGPGRNGTSFTRQYKPYYSSSHRIHIICQR